MDLLEIDVGDRKLDPSGQLLINEHNLGYLLDVLAKVEDKVNALHEIDKYMRRESEKDSAGELVLLP